MICEMRRRTQAPQPDAPRDMRPEEVIGGKGRMAAQGDLQVAVLKPPPSCLRRYAAASASRQAA